MNINVILRDKGDHFRFTILKHQRERFNLKKEDILLLEVNGEKFVKKVQNDFSIYLPKRISLSAGSLEVNILKIVSQPVALSRPSKPFIGELADIKHFIPRETTHGKPMFVVEDKDKMFIWFPIGGGVKPILIKRFVKVQELFEILGFFFGDGSIENVRSVRFINSEPSTLLHVIKFFKNLGVPKEKWKVQVIWSGKHKPSKKIKKKM